MWNTNELEEMLRNRLRDQFGEEKGERYYTRYASARDYLVHNVYPRISSTEPRLTDHSAEHIANVQINAHKLLENAFSNLSGMDMYALAVSILFHDVGNVYGREHHNHNVIQVYDTCRGSDAQYRQEKYVVRITAGAHTGKNKAGTDDTLIDVETSSSIDGYPIKLQEIAAILRLADELAEGYQRSSHFITTHNITLPDGKPLIPEDSRIYHEYANATSVRIDRGNERLVLNYNICATSDQISNGDLLNLLNFIGIRVVKLDLERKYNRYYSPLLAPFKKTEVKIFIEVDGQHAYESKVIVLNDLPSTLKPSIDLQNSVFWKSDSGLSPNQIINEISKISLNKQ
jgi:hypothetical protein